MSATAVEDLTLDWLRIEVNGIPAPAGSKRGFLHRATERVMIVDASPRSTGWKNDVADQAARKMRGELWRGPVHLRIAFGLPRPKGHFGTGRNAGTVKPSAPPFPAVKPDVDKLSRAVMDALRGVVYADDAQVVAKVVSKHYDERARTIIHVRRVV